MQRSNVDGKKRKRPAKDDRRLIKQNGKQSTQSPSQPSKINAPQNPAVSIAQMGCNEEADSTPSINGQQQQNKNRRMNKRKRRTNPPAPLESNVKASSSSQKKEKNSKRNQQQQHHPNSKKKPLSKSSSPPSIANNNHNRGRRRQRQNRQNNNSTTPPLSQPKHEPISKYTTQHYTAPPLFSSDGDKIMAPALPVIVTNDESVIQQWLKENTFHYHYKDTYSRNPTAKSETKMILGFDSESITKPPWMMPQRAKLPDGPAIVQFSTVSSCLIVRCSGVFSGDGRKEIAPLFSGAVKDVLGNGNIVKAGVSIHEDALELYQWSSPKDKEPAAEESPNDNNKDAWKMTSRFDLGRIISTSKPTQRVGLRQLAQEILDIDLPKSKQLVMSNWHQHPKLSGQQIAYAARDAWVSAAIVEKLCEYRRDVFDAGVLIDTVLKNELCMEKVDERAKKKKEYKAAMRKYKKLQERKKKVKSGNLDKDEKKDNSSSSKVATHVWGEKEEKRMEELSDIMSKLRPESPPIFDNKALGLPF